MIIHLCAYLKAIILNTVLICVMIKFFKYKNDLIKLWNKFDCSNWI